ncbi:MAG: carboxypeptidase regulatory-like domain-containing protein, partial [Planctomycetales bacterium]|nr:carboxypeptidase regulatory-like domain-containing protein [Planctomycetales bacterium]
MDSALFELSAVADHWARWCVSSLLGTTLVLSVVAAVWWIALRHRSPQLLYLLFFVVLLKPYTPFTVVLPNAIASRVPSAFHSSSISSVTRPSAFDRSASVSNLKEPMDTSAEVVAPDGSNSGVVPDSNLAGIETDIIIGQQPPREIVVAPQSQRSQVTVGAEKSPLVLSRWLIPFLVYCALLALMMIRFLVNQVRFHRMVNRAKSVSPEDLPLDMIEACRRSGIKTIPRLVEMETGSPAVWGVLRPTLILPRRLIGELSGDSLRWAVMHELAHLKRRDIVFHGLQKILTLVQFWNPAIWIASTLINRFREQACDDMALVWCDRQSVSAGEAFMHVVRSTNGQTSGRASTRRLMAEPLGVFSSGSKRACADRLTRLLDTERPLREKVGVVALLSVLTAAVVLLPTLRSVEAAEQKAAEQNAAEQNAPDDKPVSVDSKTSKTPDPFVAAQEVGEFELNIVGPKDEPVANADVEIRPKFDEPWQLLAGTFKRNHQYGTVTTADAEGRLKVKLPKEKKYGLDFSIMAPGYGLFWAQWRTGDQSEVMPAKYVAHLDAGQSVGGIVVDDDGKPVAGASVHPFIRYKMRETDESELSTGWSAKTDDKGHWRCDFVPQSYDKLTVEIVHSDYEPTHLRLPLPKYRLLPGQEPSQRITINRGITLTGKVTDAAGQPIKDANVRAVFVNETRSVKTDAEGNYRMPGCPEGSNAVTVTAKSFAPEQQEILFQRPLAPVNFKLGPGNTVRVRVVDKNGNPQKKARIFFRTWRKDSYGQGLGMVHAYTDENGIWEWNEAPADSFVADICPVGGVTVGDQLLKAREEEYVFNTIRQLVISGTVLDAATKQPIESFRVVPGLVWKNESEAFWTRRDSFDSRDGKFRLTQDRMDARHAVRIEAAGYRPAASRFINIDEGDVSLGFELQAASPVNVNVVRPDGTPAVGAEAAVGIAGSQIGVQNGDFSSTFAQRVKADSGGTLTFPPDPAP